MGRHSAFVLLFVVFFHYSSCQVFWEQPEQIHLAYGETVNEIIVTWSTFNDTEESIVEYGIGGFILTATGNSRLFIDGGPARHSQYIHRVTLPSLTPGSKYGNIPLPKINYSIT